MLRAQLLPPSFKPPRLHARHSHNSPPLPLPNPLRASFLRGGTSKGIFLDQRRLPPDRARWDDLFLRIMGSPDPAHARQLNGMGGGVSSLSKVVVVGLPDKTQHQHQSVDVVYTFAQIGIRDSVVDYSGNCGNLSSMVGVFALDEGMLRAKPVDTPSGRVATVRALNTNTGKIVDTTFPVSSAGSEAVLDLEQTAMAGVPGQASQIVLEFVDPAGARTGKLLPTGNPTDTIAIPASPHPIRVSLIDATNPTVFLTASDLVRALDLSPASSSAPSHSPIDYTAARVLSTLESIRRAGAELMNLDPTAQAQPKIAVLSPPPPPNTSTSTDVDIEVHALSMGVLHKAVPMTLGLCLGVAAGIPGTLAWEIVRGQRRGRGRGREEGMVRMRHPSGEVDVGARFAVGEDGGLKVDSAKVVRTGRRLMVGAVWW